MRSIRRDKHIIDEVINLYMKLLLERDSQLCTKDVNRQPCAFFSTFFYTKLIGYGHAQNPNTFHYENVKHWSRKKPLFQFDKLFIPCHNGAYGGMGHWGACVVYLQEKTIQYYDSAGGSGHKYMKHVQMYLVKEYENEHPQGTGPSPTEWECIETQQDTPTQTKDDCGVFTSMFIDFISLGIPITLLQAHQAPRLRQQMLLSILHKRLYNESGV